MRSKKKPPPLPGVAVHRASALELALYEVMGTLPPITTRQFAEAGFSAGASLSLVFQRANNADYVTRVLVAERDKLASATAASPTQADFATIRALLMSLSEAGYLTVRDEGDPENRLSWEPTARFREVVDRHSWRRAVSEARQAGRWLVRTWKTAAEPCTVHSEPGEYGPADLDLWDAYDPKCACALSSSYREPKREHFLAGPPILDEN